MKIGTLLAQPSAHFDAFFPQTPRMETKIDFDADTPESVEATIVELVESLARRQRELASEGRYPFRQNWVGTASQLTRAQLRRKPRLRAAGIGNLSGEVLRLVRSGVSTITEINSQLDRDHPGALNRQQVHRAIHQLTQRREIRRVAPSTYIPIEKGND